MKKTRLRTLLAVVLGLLMIGCVVPGLAPASLPAPTADTVLLVTIVAETVAAARQQTAAAAIPAIPTSTITLPPVIETPTPEPQATQTFASASGSILTREADGSTRFVDQRAGYQVVIPPGWLAVRLNEQEYIDAPLLPEAADPAIQNSLTAMQNQDPNKFRLFALDTQQGHVQSGFVTNVNFLWNEQEDISLEDFTYLDNVAIAMPTAIPGAEVLASELTTTSSNIPIGIITSNWVAQTAEGTSVPVFQKQVFLEPKVGSLTITLTTTSELEEAVVSAFDAMIETITLLP